MASQAHPLAPDVPPDFALGVLAQKIARVWADRQEELYRAVPPEQSESLRQLRLLGEQIHHDHWSAIFPCNPEG